MRFKIWALTLICLVLIGSSLLYSVSQSDEAVEKVKRRLQELVQLFNQGNSQDLASLLTEDAFLINPVTGEMVEGRAQVISYLNERMQQFKGKEVNFREEKIEFPSDGQAIVQGMIEISEQGKLVAQKARKIELVERENNWWIDVIGEADIQPPPAPSADLSSLSWLIGKWKDEDEDVAVQFDARYDKYKNFIIQRFNFSIYGVSELEGMQIIGWDPTTKTIRSWIFDSDGGYGSAIWTKEGTKWIANLTYTLSDGRKGSSINIYTPIDADHYLYSSVGRDIEGEFLSNIEPVTVVRQK